MALVLALPYAVPPLGDWLLGRDSSRSLFLTKPVDNQRAFLPIAVFTLAVPFLLWRALAPPGRMIRSSLVWLAVLFVSLQVLSAFVAPSTAASFRSLLLPLAGLGVFFLLLASEPDRRMIEKLMLAALLAAVPAGVYALVQSQGMEILPYHQISAETDLVSEQTAAKQQVSSTFGHPNYMASYFAPLVFWALYFMLARGARLRRGVGAVAFLILIAALVVAGTRGAWLAVAVAGVPFYLVLTLAPAYRRQLLFAGGVAALLAVVLLVVPNPFLRVGFDVKERLFASNEITHRLYYWTAAARMVADRPLLGVGYGAFDPVFFDYAVAVQQSGEGPEYEFLLRDSNRGMRPIFTHNDHLQIAAEGGILTALAWITLWTVLLSQILETIRDGRRRAPVALLAAAFLASVVAMGVDAGTGFPFHIPVSGFFFWLLLGSWTAWRANGGGMWVAPATDG